MNDFQNDENKNIDFFITSEDEKFHKVVCKIGEGATSEVFKVIDKKTGQSICKKVIKECAEKDIFKMVQNSIKEIEVLHQISHPCICKALFCNL